MVESSFSWIPKDYDNKRRASRLARDRERESSDLRRFDVLFFREAVEVAPPGREPRIRARDRIHGAGWNRKGQTRPPATSSASRATVTHPRARHRARAALGPGARSPAPRGGVRRP